MSIRAKQPVFTGERLILGESGQRIESDHLERYRFASRYVRNKRVLDIACGTGYAAKIMIHAGAQAYLGVDISEEGISYAKEQYVFGQASFAVGDICSLDMPESFDVITCFETIEHITHDRLALKRLYAALGGGGGAPDYFLTQSTCNFSACNSRDGSSSQPIPR